MEILKSKSERQGEYNKHVPHNQNYQTINVDKLAEKSKCLRKTANLHDFSEWVDDDGTKFASYTKLIDYQIDKFIKRYPPNFAISIRPELVRVDNLHMAWIKEGLVILKKDSFKWYLFKRELDKEILSWYGYEGNINDSDSEDALKFALDKFAIELNNLISENND